MDSIATIALASLCGFFPAILGAFLTNLVLTLLGKLRLVFCICQILTAIGACVVFYFRHKTEAEGFSLDSFMFAGILSAFSNGILGSVFAAFMGYNLSPIEKGLYFLTNNIFVANLAGGFILNLIDKSFAAFISYLIYLFVCRFIFGRFLPYGRSGFCVIKLASPIFPFSHASRVRTANAAAIPTAAVASTDSPTSVSSATASRILRFWLDDSKKGKKSRRAFSLKPEYIFVIVATFTLITGIFLKNKISNTFSKEYNELVNSELSQNIISESKTSFQNLRDFESDINASFDTIIFSSFALILISVAIIQFKYSKQKRQLELLHEHEETQKSFSRDLHDTVAQSLSVLKLSVENGDKEKALYWADQSILQTRQLIASLRLDLSEDFVSIVKDYAQTFESNFCIQTQVFEATKLAATFDTKTKEELLRIVQESLSNVVKHANASKIEIKMLDVANEFFLSISDNGKGFNEECVRQNCTSLREAKATKQSQKLWKPINKVATPTARNDDSSRFRMSYASRRSANSPPRNEVKGNAQKTKTHIGLKSMKERAQSLGAEFSIKSSEKGTTVFVKMKVR